MKNQFEELVISAEQRTKNDAEKLKRSLSDIIRTINKMMEETTSACILINDSLIKNMIRANKIQKSFAEIVSIIRETYTAKGYKVFKSTHGSGFIISWKTA